MQFNIKNYYQWFDDDGRSWRLVRPSNFGYITSCPEEIEVEDGDILHNKFIDNQIEYVNVYDYFHLITIKNGKAEAKEIEKDETKKILSKALAEFIKKNNILPVFTKLAKIFKNGKAKVDYQPTKFDSIDLKISPKDVAQPSLDFLSNLQVVVENPLGAADLGNSAETQLRIVGESNAKKDSVSVFHAKVSKLMKKSVYYMGNLSEFFLLTMEGGDVAPDTKKATNHSLLEGKFFVKASENAIYSSDINEGDYVNFNGKLKETAKEGLLIQNVRKFDKTGALDDATITQMKEVLEKQKKARLKEKANTKFVVGTQSVAGADEDLVKKIKPRIPKKPNWNLSDSPRYNVDDAGNVIRLRIRNPSNYDDILDIIPQLSSLEVLDLYYWDHEPLPVPPASLRSLSIYVNNRDSNKLIGLPDVLNIEALYLNLQSSDRFEGFKTQFPNLKRLNLTYACNEVTKYFIPYMQGLEEFYTTSMDAFPSAMPNLVKLEIHSDKIQNLKLPKTEKMRNLVIGQGWYNSGEIDVSSVPIVQTLTQLELRFKIKNFGSFDCMKLPNLEKIVVMADEIPENIGTLKNLKHLEIRGDFTKIPASLNSLPKLKTLKLHGSTMGSYPQTLVNFPRLKELDLNIEPKHIPIEIYQFRKSLTSVSFSSSKLPEEERKYYWNLSDKGERQEKAWKFLEKRLGLGDEDQADDLLPEDLM